MSAEVNIVAGEHDGALLAETDAIADDASGSFATAERRSSPSRWAIAICCAPRSFPASRRAIWSW